MYKTGDKSTHFGPVNLTDPYFRIYLEDEVLPDSQGADEEVVLLHVRRECS